MSDGLLLHPPEAPTGSIEEIIAAARALESAAASRYQQLARTMHQVGHEDVAQVFEDLAAEEETHVASVEQLASNLSAQRSGKEAVRWVLPETFSAEEAGPPALLTPYKALSVAVRTEERAFAFWSYVAAHATADRVRAAAETMARQELLHASKLRIARRRAYHAEARSRTAPESSAQPLTLESVRSDAARMAAEARAFLAAASARLSQLGDSESANLLLDVAAAIEAPGTAPIPGDDVAFHATERLKQAGPAAVLFEAEGVMERWVEHCATALARSPGEAVTAELQRLADQTVRSVARIAARLAAIEPDIRNLSAGAGQSGALPR
jgi:rubrerythrin